MLKTIVRRRKGFTLIELLIVIAIILILIAIALPNFLEAQIRARVTRAHGEIRSIETAMFSYYLDWKVYPYESENDCADLGHVRTRCGLAWLTSPVGYIKSIPTDPFPSVGDQTWYETGIKQIFPDPTIGPAAIFDRRSQTLFSMIEAFIYVVLLA